MVQYTPKYSELKQSILEQLELKPQAFVDNFKINETDARTLAGDLELHCIYNTKLNRYYFKKNLYPRLTLNENYVC